MGEKRAYKARKPGGGRKKLKPEYDAGKNLKDQMDAAVALYEEDCSLQSIADVLNLNPIKVRKLLITAGVYESEVAEKVKNTFEECGDTDFPLEEIRHERVRDCKEAVCTGNPDTFYTPLSVGVCEKYITDKGPCMAADFRDKGSGKSGLHGNHGV